MQNNTNDRLVKLCTWLGFKAHRQGGGSAVSLFYIPVPVRLAEGVKKGPTASKSVSIAGSKTLFMKILGQNDCFFKLHGIWYLTKT